MQDDALTPEEVHILYCLHILKLSPEEASERVWPNSSPIMATFYPTYLRWIWANDRELRARGELPPFPRDEFLEWSGLPDKDAAKARH